MTIVCKGGGRSHPGAGWIYIMFCIAPTAQYMMYLNSHLRSIEAAYTAGTHPDRDAVWGTGSGAGTNGDAGVSTNFHPRQFIIIDH